MRNSGVNAVPPDIKTPIISAPMAFASTPELAAAVTAAGYHSTQVLKEQIQKIRASLDIPTGEPVPVAIGFLGWILDRTESSDDPRLLAVLDENPAAVWFAFGVDLDKYIDQVHAYNKRTGRNTFIFVIISSVEDARRAAFKGVDAVETRLVGMEVPTPLPLFVLLQAILREFQTKGGPLVVAAGGISTGAQIASLLTMGADGVVLGTRFLFTPECEYSAAKKQALIKADLKSTVRAMAFDEVNRSNGWPPNCDGRAISNKVIEDYKAGLSIDERIAKFDESSRNGDESRLVVWAGVGSGLTNEIMGAGGLVLTLFEHFFEPTMIPLNSPLTKRLNISTPIICAPMAFASTPELAAEVTAAGGFGFLGFDSTQTLREKIHRVRTNLNIAPGEPVPIGIGFIGWILEMTESSDDPRLLAILDEIPTAVWFALDADWDKYVDQSVEDVRRAVKKNVDAVVVQGIEAGGHGKADAPPLLVLLQAVLNDIQFNGGPLVLAAGGISTGAHIASLLTMGVDGVVLGTRFLFTPECAYSAAQKMALLQADLGATVRTLAYDDVGRTNGWPEGFDGRAISNEVMNDFNSGLSLEARIEKFDESARNGDDSRLVIWAGVGVGLTSEIEGAADVLRDLHEETVSHLNRVTGLLA
ncbi:2-nitropropane dioxygenase [Mycena venus]|uniref:2-nitropropane dioxygenase n=1 Tax=Mycena venus TaxID=2733690 RepID=A0A8H6XMF0_9AGAR|nr:2-nitropropane dioxygenase [Mycena venus]